MTQESAADAGRQRQLILAHLQLFAAAADAARRFGQRW
jgi:hypothetical protein